MVFAELLATASLIGVLPLLLNISMCYGAILNDAAMISLDPALSNPAEILYAYPGFWALFWYRLSHALEKRNIPIVSALWPRAAMSMVRYATAIDIHPKAQISGDGILIDHGAGLVVGADTVIGKGVTLYQGVTLGATGKRVSQGGKRHPTIGDSVTIGAGAKVLGDIVIGDNSLVGANSVVTKHVPPDHTAVGIPARVLCHGSKSGKDVTGSAICELHQRLLNLERQYPETATPTKLQQSRTSATPTTTSRSSRTPALPTSAGGATTAGAAVVNAAANATVASGSVDQGPLPESNSSDEERSAERRQDSPAMAVSLPAREQSAQGRSWKNGRTTSLQAAAPASATAALEGTRVVSSLSPMVETQRVVPSHISARWIAQEKGEVIMSAIGSDNQDKKSSIPQVAGLDKTRYSTVGRGGGFSGEKRYTFPATDDRSRPMSAAQEGQDQRRGVGAVEEVLYGLRVGGSDD